MEKIQIYKIGIDLFGDEKRFKIWLKTKNIVLGNIKPEELLNTNEGLHILKDELGRIEYGVFS